MKRTLTLVLVLVAAAGVLGLASGSEIYAVDGDHDLDDQSAIDEYESEGVVTGEADDIDLEFTVSDSSEHVDADPFIDSGTMYVQLDYQEDIDRSIRFHVPSEYFHPYEDQSLSTHGGADAEMEPIDGGNYTAVTAHMDGNGTVVLEVSTVESTLWEYRSGAYDWLDDATGYEVPRIAGSGEGSEWQYVDQREFAGNETVSVDQGATVQYDRSNSSNESTWTNAPKCGTDAQICTVEQGGEQIIMTDNANETAPVRYKADTSLMDNISAGLNEVVDEVNSQIESFQNAFSEVV